MNYYKNIKNLESFKKVIKNLTVFCALIFSIAVVFYSSQTFSQAAALPSCTSVAVANVGNNCLFSYDGVNVLPLCNRIPNHNLTTITPERLFNYPYTASEAQKQHRINCLDLSDMPLCNQLDDPNSVASGKNCVKECKDAFPNNLAGKVRGIDYAIHNLECVRFCDNPEPIFSTSPGAGQILLEAGQNCVARKCHQLPDGTLPTIANCSTYNCGLLTKDELNEPNSGSNKFAIASNKYCDGFKKIDTGEIIETKCLEFSQDKLPYLRWIGSNPMCSIHNCPKRSENCGSDSDINAINGKGSSYVSQYIHYINGTLPLSSTSLCISASCKPVLYPQYRCLPNDAVNPTVLNPNCDPNTTCNMASRTCNNNPNISCSNNANCACNGGYCSKKVDCNLPANSGDSNCAEASGGSGIINGVDMVDSWLYRPSPDGGLRLDHIQKDTRLGQSNEFSRYCYSDSNMRDNGWGTTLYGAGGTVLGYYHDYLGMSGRSPGICTNSRYGNRGSGYIYLCGNDGVLHHGVSDETGYFRGYVDANFGQTTGGGSFKVTACLRFKNTMSPDKTCGKRKCGITCSGNCGGNGSEVCGDDVCRDLSINESSPKECIMNDSSFTSNLSGKGCATIVDDNIRLRAVAYSFAEKDFVTGDLSGFFSERVCTFLDVKGPTAYHDLYFSGKEKLTDGVTCVSGSSAGAGVDCSGGKDTNEQEGLATPWRTIKQIKYIASDYHDAQGKLFKAQECPKVPLRISPPKLYNLANQSNSERLFSPPLFILNTMITRDGAISIPQGLEAHGLTDFNFPEIQIQFGATLQKLSLGIGDSGGPSGRDPKGNMTIATIFNNISYSSEIFVKKEFDANSLQPMFCLYKKIKDTAGIYLEPLRVDCVKRNFPEIMGAQKGVVVTLANPSMDINTDATISLKYISYGANSVNNNCTGDDTCTASSYSLTNYDSSIPSCDPPGGSAAALEGYKICAQRNACSRINIECIRNEIAIRDIKRTGGSADSLLTIRRNCNSVILPYCNHLKGINDTPEATIYDQTAINGPSVGNNYGWFNEICFVSGFETKIKDVIAKKTNSNVMGKCLIDVGNKKLGANCDAGGNAPDCPCLENRTGYTPAADEVIRKQTPREAGLCVDIPPPLTCAPIDDNPYPNSDGFDLDYVTSSLNQTSYGTGYSNAAINVNNVVHKSHQSRSNSVFGHATFPISIANPSNYVDGECRGFWKEDHDSGSGLILTPQARCVLQNNTATWITPISYPCVRYSCEAVATNGPDPLTGAYQGNYAFFEVGENRGFGHGFATWPSLTKTTDFPESATFSTCIPGFKTSGANMLSGNPLSPTTVARANEVATAIGTSRGTIVGYSGGTFPTRSCNQIGQWGTVNNPCIRINCPAISPTRPTSSSDNAAWGAWNNTGGATFPSAPASRSTSTILPESIATGACKNDLGYFQAGDVAPSRSCDYLGNWGPVQNPCVTRCDAIVRGGANNGNASWPEVSSDIYGTTLATASSCNPGTVPSPYTPIRDDFGRMKQVDNYQYSIYLQANPLSIDILNTPTSIIPQTFVPIAALSPAGSLPKRSCILVVDAASGATAHVWSGTSSSCTDHCPGSVEDPRFGAGNTVHFTFSNLIPNAPRWISNILGGYEFTAPNNRKSVIIPWANTPLGQWSEVIYPNDPANHNAAKYDMPRPNNGYYRVARRCGSNGAWETPVVQCSLNSNLSNNITLGDSFAVFPNSNFTNILPAQPSATAVSEGNTVTGVCKSNYYTTSPSTPKQYTCEALDALKNIDQYQLKFTGTGTVCSPKCSITPGKVFAAENATYTGAENGLKDVGTILNLRCSSGSGHMIIGGSNSVAEDNCGVATGSSRTASAPSATCGSDGQWIISNPCSACRGCDTNSPISGSKTSDARVECCTSMGCSCEYCSCPGCSSCCRGCSNSCTDSSWTRSYDFSSWITNLVLTNQQSFSNSAGVGGDQYCGWRANYPTGRANIAVQCQDGTKVVTGH
jgi:hypothetical protein